MLENWDNATSGHKQMGGAHDVQWIPPGLPGAGHCMVFNNGQYLFQRTPQSSILEINPFLDANGRDTGKYVNPPEAGYRREDLRPRHAQLAAADFQANRLELSLASTATVSSATSAAADSGCPTATR